MSDLWPATCVYTKVRHLQDLLSGICIRRQASWGGKIELVGRPAATLRIAKYVMPASSRPLNLKYVKNPKKTTAVHPVAWVSAVISQKPEPRVRGENDGDE